MRRVPVALALAVLVLGVFAGTRTLTSRPSDVADFVHFESGHVHPVAITPSGNRLLVVNTPDNRLSVFDLTGTLPVRIAEIPVGLEPVSVAARTDGEAWVVNQLSDDVSVVDLGTGHVRATVRVGDEPADVVFANGSAYVSVSQEDAVKVVDPGSLAVSTIIPIDGRMPRALVATADGARVYVAVFNAGNRTSIVNANDVGGAAPPLVPPLKPGLGPVPNPLALIVKQDNTGAPGAPWRDELGRVWGPASSPNGPPRVGYDLFDVDVAQISTANQAVTDTFSDIGTLNFGLAVSATGNVVVTATEARNLVRLEPNVRGHLVNTRAAIISPAGAVTPVELNPGIDYSVSPGPPADLNQAIGIPTGVAWAADGASFYVTALANDRIARVSSSGAILARAKVVAGPTGVVVDAARARLYVVGRFRNQVETLDAANLGPLGVAAIGMDPTPDAIVNGRKFFYGGFTSGHGEQACATCHVFGDFDNIAWDLGDPLADSIAINTAGQLIPLIDPKVHPVKGPMATQSLRGLPNTGMLHWRADRQNLSAFNPAFVGLMGRTTQLPDSEMAAFNDFVLPLVYPPNPRQNLDRSYPDAALHVPSARRGRQFFFNRPVEGPQATCNTCHAGLSFGPGTNGQIINNQALLESQDMKVPHLRNLYKKTGFLDQVGAVNKRGFGFTHDGAIDNLFDFLQFPGFNFNDPPPAIQTPDENRRDVEAFLLAFDTGMAPAVGHQITFRGPNNSAPSLVNQLQTLRDQFDSTFIDLIAKGRIVDLQNPAGTPRGWVYLGADQWRPDRSAEAPISSLALRSLGGAGTEVTVTGVPRGSGQRIGIDRDRDGHLDGDELAAGSDPGNPASTPDNVDVEGGETRSGLRAVRPNPFHSSTDIAFALARPGPVECVIHDLFGREIRVLARGLQLEAGAHRLQWNGRRDDGGEAPAGVYFVRLRTAQGSSTHALVRIR